jgi:hypothetical protein
LVVRPSILLPVLQIIVYPRRISILCIQHSVANDWTLLF